MVEYAGLYAKDAEYSFEQLTSDAWVRSKKNRTAVMGASLDDGLECPGTTYPLET